MKLASLKEGGRDGTLIVVDRRMKNAVAVPGIAPTLQAAFDNWAGVESGLQATYMRLNKGKEPDAFAFDPLDVASPLPRAYQWADGSAYLSHMELVRRARGAGMSEGSLREPWIYQGGSDGFLGPTDPIPMTNHSWGLDFEGELAVITDDVPMGCTPKEAGGRIKLLMLVNDVSLRNLIPGELTKGFGFFQGKPASAFSPVAATPDELGDAWDSQRVHLDLLSHLNGELVGHPNAGIDMTFDFPHLITHAARTRNLCAGTIIGSGTVSNRDHRRGSSCLAEKRMLEIIENGVAETLFLDAGDRVRIEMLDLEGNSVFGAIDQQVAAVPLS